MDTPMACETAYLGSSTPMVQIGNLFLPMKWVTGTFPNAVITDGASINVENSSRAFRRLLIE